MAETGARKLDNFAVLGRMCDLNRDIRLSPLDNVTHLRKVKAGTQVTIGVAGDVVDAIYTGKLVGFFLLYDAEQFRATKAEMLAEVADG